MPLQLTTYSGKDLNFTLSSQLTGVIQAAGVNTTGLKQLKVTLLVDQTVMEAGMDGAVAVSAVPGDMGDIEIQVWQTSVLQSQFLTWYNALRAARDAGDVSNWATTTIIIKNIIDGSQHLCQGVAPVKVPEKTYGTQAQAVSWIFKAANIVST